ncbi:hypothetical protein LCGC14_0651260 [marine sediment metagenome]|uniref:Uncharacterized protein n=1 Tax=marine sediment metagenome TaxID=412755 RepID=A0A0F9RG26_9ZZZZ
MNLKITLLQQIKRISEDQLMNIQEIIEKEIERRLNNAVKTVGAAAIDVKIKEDDINVK